MQTWVERPIHLRFDGGGSLTQSEAFKLCGEVVDLAVELTRPDGSHGLFEAGSVRFADLLAGHCPRKGGGGPVVALCTCCPASRFWRSTSAAWSSGSGAFWRRPKAPA